MKTADKIERIAVPARMHAEHLRAFEFYSESYGISVPLLLSREAYGQAETLVDDPFGNLEWIDEEISRDETQEVVLEFCPEVHAILSRTAELLHRPLQELLHGLLGMGGEVLGNYITKALESDEGMSAPDMASWANESIEFERLAKRNEAPKSRGCSDGWTSFNIRRPEAPAPKPLRRNPEEALA